MKTQKKNHPDVPVCMIQMQTEYTSNTCSYELSNGVLVIKHVL